MKLKDGFVLREIADETILVPVGEQAAELDGIIRLNPAAVVIWKALEEESGYDGVLKAVLDAFEVDEATARADLDEFLAELEKAGILEK